MLKFIATLLLVCFPTSALAEGPVKLVKANTAVKFDIDMQCMSNETALSLYGKIKLCEETCEIKLEEILDLRKVDLELFDNKLSNQEIMYLSILNEKDNSIELLQSEVLSSLERDDFSWWKATLVLVGGVVVGSVTTVLVLHYAD